MHDHEDHDDDEARDGWWFDDDSNCWRSKVGDGTIEVELYEDELNEHPIVQNLRALLASAAEHVPRSAPGAAAIRHAVAGASTVTQRFPGRWARSGRR